MKNKLTKLPDGKMYLELHDPVSASVFVGKYVYHDFLKEACDMLILLGEVGMIDVRLNDVWNGVWIDDPYKDYPIYIPMETVKEVIENKLDEPHILVDKDRGEWLDERLYERLLEPPKVINSKHWGLYHLNFITITHGDTNLIKEIINYE